MQGSGLLSLGVYCIRSPFSENKTQLFEGDGWIRSSIRSSLHRRKSCKTSATRTQIHHNPREKARSMAPLVQPKETTDSKSFAALNGLHTRPFRHIQLRDRQELREHRREWSGIEWAETSNCKRTIPPLESGRVCFWIRRWICLRRAIVWIGRLSPVNEIESTAIFYSSLKSIVLQNLIQTFICPEKHIGWLK